MSTVTRTYKVDDLDGTTTEGVETIQFNAEGTNYEIDLSPENAARLREKLRSLRRCRPSSEATEGSAGQAWD